MTSETHNPIYSLFTGRTARMPYFGFCMLCVFIFGIFAYLASPPIFSAYSNINPFVGLFIVGLLLLFYAVSTIRRLHDMNNSGWLTLIPLGLLTLGFILPVFAVTVDYPRISVLPPRLCLVFFLVFAICSLVLFITPGTKGPNKYSLHGYANARKTSPAKKENALYVLLPLFIAILLLAPSLISSIGEKPNDFKLAPIVCGVTTKEDILALETGIIIEEESYLLVYQTNINGIPCEASYFFPEFQTASGIHSGILAVAKFTLKTKDKNEANWVMEQLIATYGEPSSRWDKNNITGLRVWAAKRSNPFRIYVDVQKDYKNMTITFSNRK